MMTKRINVDDSEVIEGDFDDVSKLEKDLDEELNAIFADFGGDEAIDEYQIRVYRVQEGKGKMGYLFACLPAELPILDRLRDEYGGGDFEVRVLKNNKLFRRRKTIIESPNRNVKTAAPQQNNLVSIAQTMDNGFMKLGELIAAQSASTQMNPVTMQSEMLQNMLAMKEMLGIGSKPESPIKMLGEFFELQKLIGAPEGGAGASDVLLSMANQVLPKLAEMGQVEQDYNINRRPRKNIPSIRRRKPIIQDDKSGNPMKMHLIFLCSQAALGNEPRTYAKMVIDNTDKDKILELRNFISGENALVNMGKVHKSVLKYPDWFTELGYLIVKMIDSDASIEKKKPAADIPGMVGSQILATNV